MDRFVLSLIVGACATFGCAGREPPVVSPSAAKTSATVVSPSVVPGGRAPGASAGSHAPAAANDAPWSAEVDRDLPAPDGFHLLVARPDHHVLVAVTGTEAFFDPHLGRQTRGWGTAYLASFSLPDGCIEATYKFPAQERAAATGLVEDALKMLNAPEARSDVARARELTAAYGPNVAPYLFDAAETHVVVSANGEDYEADVATLKFHHLSATAGPMVLAADGAHAALTMRRPLAGMYRTALFDLAAGTFQGLGRSAVSELYPEAAGTWLAATQVPGKGGRQREAKVCLLRIVPQTHAETVLACFPTREVSSTISSISPDGHFVVLKVRELSPDEGVAVVDTTSGATVAEVPGHQIYLHVDDTGRVVWDESADGKKSEVHLGAGHEVVVLPGGEGVAVGFTLDHQVIVGKPSAEIAAFDGPLKTLRDVARCGHLRTLPTPGSGMVHE